METNFKEKAKETKVKVKEWWKKNRKKVAAVAAVGTIGSIYCTLKGREKGYEQGIKDGIKLGRGGDDEDDELHNYVKVYTDDPELVDLMLMEFGGDAKAYNEKKEEES